MGRIRHSVNDIPKTHFTLTLANLIEFQQPHIAAKFTNILKEIVRQGKTLESEFVQHQGSNADYSQLIEMYWSLLQIEKVVVESQDPTRTGVRLINRENLSFLNKVELARLKPKHFQ